jgi:hypothetical protein
MNYLPNAAVKLVFLNDLTGWVNPVPTISRDKKKTDDTAGNKKK